MSSDPREQLQDILGGGFRLSRELGGGGMAKVFVADDAIVGRRVVVKVLAPELAAGVNLERFRREIQVAGMLHHPRIVPVLSAGQTDDILYYTMPYIEGDSLRTLIEREQQLSVDRALEIARDVTDALEHAHAHNIVHRDIKPDNILIESASGRAVVTDFGIARAIEKAADISSVTSTGLTLGTPTYMSPEQAGAEKHVDGRSDIYSLGCVMYEMLAGMPPFTGSTARSIIARHMTEPPPPIRVVRPDLPDGVVRLIDRMLAKVPSGRFANARKLAAALEKPELVTEPGWREVPRSRAWLLAAALPVLLAAGWLLARGGPGSPANAEARDPTRVAVLYFDAPKSDSGLLEVGRAITSDLISSLRTGDITVISEPGIAQFPPTASPQTVSRSLNVGTLIYGRLEPSGAGDSLRVRVRLVDDGAVERESFDVYSGRATTLALRDAVVQRVAQRLVGPLGREVQLKRWRAGTASESAWLLQARAQNLQMRGRDADLAGAHGDARSAYDAADSLFALASRADEKWSEPWIGRSTVSWNRSRSSDVKRQAQLLDTALARVGKALALQPTNARALAQRGQLRFDKWQWGFGGASAVLRDSAESDLRSALTMDSTLARGWSTYSAILQAKGDRIGAVAAARQAIHADAYQREIVPSMNRLIVAELTAERYDSARTLCNEGVQRFPSDRVMRQCTLNVLGYAGAGNSDVKRAWEALAVEERDGLYGTVNGVWAPGRFFVAAVLARSGMKDSALAVLSATRAALRAGAQPLAGGMQAAYAWTLLGQRDSALTLLEDIVRQQPAERANIAQLPWFRSLRSDPRFVRLAGGG